MPNREILDLTRAINNMFKKLFTKSNTLLISILALASFMRLYKINDYLTFLGDEGRDVLVVYNILHGHLTLLGPTASVGGFFLGPIYYYFMTPFLWIFNYNPVGPAVMVALFGIATVWLIYFIGSKFFTITTGLVAAALYAIAPIIVAYSRSSWNPNPLPFFVLSLLYFLYKGVEKKSWKYILVSGVFLGIAMQLHYLATFVAAIVFVYILTAFLYDAFVKKQSVLHEAWATVKTYLIFFGGFLIGWSPFLLFEIRHGFNNIKSIFHFVFHSQGTGVGQRFDQIIGDVFFRIFGRLVTAFPPPNTVNIHTHFPLAIWYYGTLLLAFCSIGFLLFVLIKNWKKRAMFLQYVLLALWLGVGVALFGFYRKEIYDYYFAFLFPLPFLLVGALIAWLVKQNIFLKILGIGLFIFLFAINIQGIPFRYPPNRQLQQVAEISRVVYNEAGGKPFNFALITGGNSDYAYRYFLTLWGNPPVTILNPQVDPKRTSVTKQLLVVCEQLPCHPEGSSLWEIAGFGRAQIVGEWNVSVVQVYKLTHYYGK